MGQIAILNLKNINFTSMEEQKKEEKSLIHIDNVNIKRNPVTSVLGGGFIIITFLMYLVKYVIPAFVILKQEIPYEWYTPLLPLAIGILLVFINDDYFSRIFSRVDKVAAKKTDTQQ